MHLLVVHFQLADLADDAFLARCERLAPAVADLPGLLGKVWLADPASRTYGGVSLWWDRAAMERFVEGELFAALAAPPEVIDVRVTNFAVLDGPTRVTLGAMAPHGRGAADAAFARLRPTRPPTRPSS
jgi:hypothetical protein